MIVLKLAIAKKSIGCSFGTMLNIKHDGSKTEHLLTLKIKCFWYHVKHDGSKTSQHVYIKIIVFQKILKTLLYD